VREKTLGIELSPMLLPRADEVVEMKQAPIHHAARRRRTHVGRV